ncbi:MAG TPA: lysylphosphatidylglycerol synthase transmembrane domain-containing protein [Bryobacteraceae bacterium]|nr:lysylphosphatidylglycerol synthase transmembrane domain-containing protein [Bryobacteraceae bacterium]
MIRSSLESKIYILERPHPAYPLARRYAFAPDSKPPPAKRVLNRLKESPKRAKPLLFVTVGAIILIAILAYRLHGTPFDWALFLTTFYRVDLKWLAVSICLMLLTYVGRALRWEVMLRPLGRKVSLRALIYDTAIGFTAIVLLGRAGEVVRPYLISIRAAVPFSSQMAAWLLERILDLLVVLLLFGFGLTHIPSQGVTLGPGLRWVLGAGGYLVAGITAACVLFLILFRHFSEPMRKRLLGALTFLPPKQFERVDQMLAAFTKGMESTKDPWHLTLLVLYTVIEWLIIVASYYALFHSFPATAKLATADVVVFLGFVAFGSIVQIPGVGGGIQVASIVVLTEIYGMSLESATGVAIFIWLITFVVVVPFGLACAFHQGINWSKLKHLPQDVPL